MVWEEVATALSENRREIVLSGHKINDRLSTNGIDITLFHLKYLNYLSISESSLSLLPDEFERLVDLQHLVLHSNQLEDIPQSVTKLGRLKLLDVSNNSLKTIPDVSTLLELETLNASTNHLDTFPSLAKLTNLKFLNISGNHLKKMPDVCHSHLANLQELVLSNNKIDSIPPTVRALASLKILRMDSNQLKILPAELSDLGKLKELNLVRNPLMDKRLQKIIDQKGNVKNILTYVKQNCKRSMVTVGSSSKSTSPQVANKHKVETGVQYPPSKKILVKRFSPETVKIVMRDEVKSVRPHMVACIIQNIKFDQELFDNFIKLQTRLHDTVCSKRNFATIATHDWKKIAPGDLTYTAIPPKELKILPLNSTDNLVVQADQLVRKLRIDADQIRKDKKRSNISGVHKYLTLLADLNMYPAIINSNQEVISFPPITNSEITKISVDTTDILLEVTSSNSLEKCRQVADAVLKETLRLLGTESITVQQVKSVDGDGNLKLLYPSYQDLVIEFDGIIVERDYKV